MRLQPRLVVYEYDDTHYTRRLMHNITSCAILYIRQTLPELKHMVRPLAKSVVVTEAQQQIQSRVANK